MHGPKNKKDLHDVSGDVSIPFSRKLVFVILEILQDDINFTTSFTKNVIPLLRISNIYLFTAWSTVLLEKLTGSQLVKDFPAFYGTRRFITAVTSAHHLSLS